MMYVCMHVCIQSDKHLSSFAMHRLYAELDFKKPFR